MTDATLTGDETLGPAPRAFTRTTARWGERIIETLLALAAFSSVAVTFGIVGTLLYESSTFFAHVSLVEFLTDTLWTPLFAAPHFGIMPLVAGTLVTTAVALTVNAAGGATVRTVVLLTPDEVDAAAKRSVDYRPPGG